MSGNWNPCGRGAAAELFVAAKIVDLGGEVLVPWSHAVPYDLVSDFEGALARIQVKRAYYVESTDRWDVDIRHRYRPSKLGPQKKSPDRGGYDYLIAMAGEAFYVVPSSLTLGRASLVLRPEPCRSRARGPEIRFDVEVYREAWSLLKGGENTGR